MLKLDFLEMTSPINPIYAQLLKEYCDIEIPGYIPPTAPVLQKQEPNILECCGPIELNAKEGYYFCWTCGLIKDDKYIVQEEEPEYSGFKANGAQTSYGGKSSYTYNKYRAYKPLTHFREHIRMYLGQRFHPIPDQLIADIKSLGKVDVNSKDAYQQVRQSMKQLRHRTYEIQVWDYNMRRLQTKHYKTPKFYKDIFSIIYTLGGHQPHIQNLHSIIQAYRNLQYQFLQLKTRHNMPSHYMVLDILLRRYNNQSYYNIPYLKDDSSRDKVIEILQLLNDNVQKDHGIPKIRLPL